MVRPLLPVFLVSVMGVLTAMGCRMLAGSSADLVVSATTIPATAVHNSQVWPLGATIEAHRVSDWGGTSGTRSLFVVADALGVVSETNNANNTSRVGVAVLYDRIIIDTYKPTTGSVSTDTYISLFNSAGDPTEEIGTALWTNDAGAIAEDDNGNPYAGYTFFARLDLSTGIAPGRYYIRVRGATSTENGAYAIRALTSIDPVVANQYPGSAYFTVTNAGEANPLGGFYETDDNPTSGAVPASPVDILFDTPLNRYLQSGDVDWFVLTLP